MKDINLRLHLFSLGLGIGILGLITCTSDLLLIATIIELLVVIDIIKNGASGGYRDS